MADTKDEDKSGGPPITTAVDTPAVASEVSDTESQKAWEGRMAEHRKHLVDSERKSQEDFDKTVLSLSGGALGISFVFLKDVIGPNPIQEPNLLFAAWLAWGASTFCVLASYYLSHLALRKAIRQIDDDADGKQEPGGHLSTITAVLNAAGAILFLIGVCAITLFAHSNLKTKGEVNGPTKSTAAAPQAAASVSASGSSSPVSAARKN